MEKKKVVVGMSGGRQFATGPSGGGHPIPAETLLEVVFSWW